MSARTRSKREVTCESCNSLFWAQKRGKATARFCTPECRGRAKRGKMPKRKKVRAPMTCTWCSKTVLLQPHLARDRKFCGRVCATAWWLQQPEHREACRRGGTIAGRKGKGRPNPKARVRMLQNNPMYDPAISKKVGAALKNRPFPAKRGGNGQPLPLQQQRLARALGWPTEVAVGIPRKIRAQYRTPKNYKIDIASKRHMIAVEVDGISHKALKVQEADRRKDLVLRSLGWNVLRFSNTIIRSSLPNVVQAVRGYTTSK